MKAFKAHIVKCAHRFSDLRGTLKSGRYWKPLLAVALFAFFAVILVTLVTDTSQPAAPQPALVIDIQPMKANGADMAESDMPAPEDYKNRYQAPFDHADPRPRIGIIMTGIGLSPDISQKAILELPNAVTMAISPYAKEPAFWIDRSVQSRHEVLLGIPMEPRSFPEVDPGSLALLKRNSWPVNLERLKTIRNDFDKQIGFINLFGNAYLNDETQRRYFTDWIKAGNAIFIEHRIDAASGMQDMSAEINADYLAAEMDIDALAVTDSIIGRLRRLEEDARENGYVIGIASPYPITLEVIKQWAKNLDDRGIALAPISAVLAKKKAEK